MAPVDSFTGGVMTSLMQSENDVTIIEKKSEKFSFPESLEQKF